MTKKLLLCLILTSSAVAMQRAKTEEETLEQLSQQERNLFRLGAIIVSGKLAYMGAHYLDNQPIFWATFAATSLTELATIAYITQAGWNRPRYNNPTLNRTSERSRFALVVYWIAFLITFRSIFNAAYYDL